MPTFRYKGYNSKGISKEGSIDAESERQALLNLKAQGIITREIKSEADVPQTSTKLSFKRGISTAELSLFTRRLSTLVASSVPLFEAITSLHEQEETGELKKVLLRVREKISEGASLSRALSAEASTFSESYVSMVSAGEASGALDTVLDSLADFLEEQEQVKSRITSALAYPILMLLVGGGVMIFLLTVVIPKIVVIFEDSKAALPFLTIALIKISHLLRNWWWIPAILIIIAIPLYRKAMLKELPRLKRDRLILRTPLAGSMIQQLLLSRFARVLGLLLTSGVPIIRALEITSEVLVNRVYRGFLKNVMQEVAEGGTLSSSLKKSPLFPPLIVHLISVGEKGGTLEKMLIKGGTAYEREFNTRLTRLMGLMEPILVLGMGVAVGIVVMAVLLPIFEMNQLIK